MQKHLPIRGRSVDGPPAVIAKRLVLTPFIVTAYTVAALALIVTSVSAHALPSSYRTQPAKVARPSHLVGDGPVNGYNKPSP